MMLNKLAKNFTKHYKLLSVLLFGFAFTLFVFTDIGQAHAVDASEIPTDILQQMSTFDNNLGVTESPPISNTNCPEAGTQSADQTEEWLWANNANIDGNAANGASFSATAGQNLTLNIQTMLFICHMAVNTGTPYVYPYALPDDSPNTAFGAPNGYILSKPGATNQDGSQNGCTGGNGYWGWCGDALPKTTQFNFNSASATVDSGPSAPSIGTTLGGSSSEDICFQSATRYWYPNFVDNTPGSPYYCNYPNQTSTVSLTMPTKPGTYVIDVTVNIAAASWFTANGDNLCLANGGSNIPGDGTLDDSNQCPTSPSNFYITVNVSSAFTNKATLSPAPSSDAGGIVTPSSGSVSPGQTLAFEPGMQNTGPSAGTATKVAFYASTGASEVTNADNGVVISKPPNGTPGNPDGSLTSRGWTGSEYYWDRSDPVGSVNYDPTYFQVSASATLGSTICFVTKVTPANSVGGSSLSSTLCYIVSQPVTCNVSPSTDPVQPDTNFYINISVTPAVTGINGTSAVITIGSSTYTVTLDSSGKAQQQITNSNDSVAPIGKNTINGSFAASQIAGVGGATCTNTVTVAAQPYFRIFGGDIFVGTDSQSIPSCYDYPSGLYSTDSTATTSSDNAAGAGTTLAALATGDISGFVSGQANSNALLNMLDPFTYSNWSGTDGDYGTNATTTGCAPTSVTSQNDYYNELGGSSAPVCGGGTNVIGPMKLGLNAGEVDKYICTATSDVTIAGPITYDLNNPNFNASNLPVFEVVVKGANINIEYDSASQVTKLAGTYIAEQSNGVGGRICDSYNTLTSQCAVDLPSPSSYNDTNTSNDDRLVVDGTFVANQLDLYRTYGTAGDDVSNVTSPSGESYDAEEFDYSPVNWLAPNPSTTPEVDAITSLPPVY